MRRIDQILSNLGYCSRNEARGWIADGRVTIGEEPAAGPSQKCHEPSVRVDGEPLDHPDGLLLMLNKPLGLTCTHDRNEGPRIYDLFPDRWLRRNPSLTSVGRLDQDTAGLLLVTDQTALVHQLTSPKRKVAKHYRATLDHPVPADRQLALCSVFRSGELLLDEEETPCLPAQLTWLGSSEARVVLTEGRYHQVRRMFAAQGLYVTGLTRDRFGPLELGDLPAGQWKTLPLDFCFHTPL